MPTIVGAPKGRRSVVEAMLESPLRLFFVFILIGVSFLGVFSIINLVESLVQAGLVRLLGGAIESVELLPWENRVNYSGISQGYLVAVVDMAGIMVVMLCMVLVSDQLFKTHDLILGIVLYTWLLKLMFYWVEFLSVPFFSEFDSEISDFTRHLSFSPWVVFGFTVLCSPLILRLISWWTMRLIHVYRNWRKYIIISTLIYLAISTANYLIVQMGEVGVGDWQRGLVTLFF